MPAGVSCARSGRKLAAFANMAVTMVLEGVVSHPENSRELPISKVPVADVVAVKVVTSVASSAGISAAAAP